MIALDKLRRTVDDFGNQVRELLDTMEYQISEAAIEVDKLLVSCSEPAAVRRTVDDFGNQVRELLDTMEYQISEAAIEADKLLAVWCNEPAAVDLEGIAQLSARLDDLEARIRESLGPATFIWSIREFQNEFGRVDQSQDRRAGVRIESVGDPLTPGQLEALRRIQADYEGALDRPHHILPAIAGRLAAVGLRLRDVRTTAGDYGRIFNIEVAPVEGGN